MGSYIPSITLPGYVFEKPAVAILVPVLLGTGVGFSQRRRGPSWPRYHAVLTPPQASDTQDTYLALKQPPLRPPPYVFGPVWTALYGCMGYASYCAWRTGTASLNPSVHEWTKQAASLYTVQLGLNLIWMPLFFKFHRPIAATVDITLLTGITGYLTWMWSHVDETATSFMLPYLGWLSFATYLCVSSR